MTEPDAESGHADEPRPPTRTWPSERELADDEVVALTCPDCKTPWRVHQSMRGFRLRCVCGEWLDLPLPTEQGALPVPVDELPAELPALPDRPRFGPRAGESIELPGDDGEVIFRRIPTNAQLAPGALRRASADNQARWTNRTILEFVFPMAALLGPQVLAVLMSSGNELPLLLPFASVLSFVLVAMVLLWAGPYGRQGLRGAPLPNFAEALLAAGIGIAIAFGYTHLLETLLPDLPNDELRSLIEGMGMPAALFVIAVTPAVLEELVFRGLLQGRLMALLGRRVGLLVTAAAFAICHGAPAVLPIHFGLGLYLGWLRERSGSLLPGMLMHFVYNGTLVVLSG